MTVAPPRPICPLSTSNTVAPARAAAMAAYIPAAPAPTISTSAETRAIWKMGAPGPFRPAPLDIIRRRWDARRFGVHQELSLQLVAAIAFCFCLNLFRGPYQQKQFQ